MVHSFLDVALDESDWLVSSFCRFNLGERAQGKQYIGDWVSRKVGLDVSEKKKPLFPLAIEPLTDPAHSLVPISNILSRQQQWLQQLQQNKNLDNTWGKENNFICRFIYILSGQTKSQQKYFNSILY
jgi:hypothetical protein